MNRLGRNLPRTPDMRLQRPTGDSAVGHKMNVDDQSLAAKTAVQSAVDGPETDPAGIGNGLGGEALGDGNFHTSNFTHSEKKARGNFNPFGEIAENAKITHRIPVSRARIPRDDSYWPQRLFVMGKIDALIASGVPVEELAKDFGLETTSSIELGWRYGYNRRPHRNTVPKIAKRLGLTELEVFNPTPEIPQEKKDELTLAKEALSGAMGLDTVNKLTNEQILAAYRVAMTTARAMLAQ